MLWAAQFEPERAALAYRHLDTVLDVGLIRADGSNCHAAELDPESSSFHCSQRPGGEVTWPSSVVPDHADHVESGDAVLPLRVAKRAPAALPSTHRRPQRAMRLASSAGEIAVPVPEPVRTR